MQIPFALSLSKYLNSAGGDAGFASLLAVALLVILYFAHARETKTLRERLGEAHDRIDALEARLAQLIQLQAARQQQPPAPVVQRPAVVPAPASVGARAMGSAVASLRQVPGATARASDNGVPPAAPYGVGAPALMSATNTLPEAPEPAVRVVAPAALTTNQDTMLVAPVAAEATGNGARVEAGRAVATAVSVPAAAAATAVGRGGPGAGNSAPPRVQIRPEAPGGPVPRRPSQPPRGSLLDDSDRGPRRGRRVLGVIGAVVAIVAIVFVLTKLTAGSTPSRSGSHKTAGKSVAKSGVFKAHNVIVAVLNGTSVSGLAKDVSQDLDRRGYRQGNITNAAVQTQKSTIVYYVPNQQVAAQHVAKALKLGPSAVQPATQAVIQSCAATPTSGANSCEGDVIVSVGSDRSNLASAGQSG